MEWVNQNEDIDDESYIKLLANNRNQKQIIFSRILSGNKVLNAAYTKILWFEKRQIGSQLAYEKIASLRTYYSQNLGSSTDFFDSPQFDTCFNK